MQKRSRGTYAIAGRKMIAEGADMQGQVPTLAAGEGVPPKTAHYVHGKDGGPREFLNVQGVGVYDFVPVG